MNQYLDLSHQINNNRLDDEVVILFQQHILNYYREHGRFFAWRQPPHDPYHIMISEVMLQQTQTHRVIDKFALFTTKFSDITALAQASLHDVLTAWQGLGYNRRGQALHKAAQIIVHEYQGIFPSAPEQWQVLPGIGPATAASICAFAFNMPTILVRSRIKINKQVTRLMMATTAITINITLRFTSCMLSQSKILGYTSRMLRLFHSGGSL